MFFAVSWWSEEKRLAVASFSCGGGPAPSEPLYHAVSVGAFSASTSALYWRMLEINVTVKALRERYIAFTRTCYFRGLLMNKKQNDHWISSLHTVLNVLSCLRQPR